MDEVTNIIVTATTCGGESQIIIIPSGDTDFSKIYQLSNGFCVSIVSGGTTTQFSNSMLVYGPFEDCNECSQVLSGSTGGNNGLVCEDNCSGGTFTVIPPHPVYSNGQLKGIEQINAVTIGGNGLNS